MDPGRYLNILRRTNWAMTVSACLLTAAGLVFLYSACHICGDRPAMRYDRQIGWVLAGIAGYVGFTLLDYRLVLKQCWWIYGAAIVMLVLVLLEGKTVYGGRRWLYITSSIGFQPAEFAKVALILALSRYLSAAQASSGTWRVLAVSGVLTLIPAALIVVQPDLGSAAVFVPIAFAMMFVSGVQGRALGILVLSGVVGVAMVLSAFFLPEKLGCGPETQEKVMRWTGLRSYQKERIAVFFDPGRDPLGAGWNKMQSEIAVGSGGLTGKGYGKGTSKLLAFLPLKVAPTDFIFSVIAEEEGFAGAVAMLTLFGVLLTGGLVVASVAPESRGQLLCVGVMAMLFIHVFVNIAMTIGILPITGLPLPLVSAGGSIMISVTASLGMVQSVYVRRRQVRY